ASPGALEGHVLEQVRHAVQLGALVPRAAGHPDAERRRFDLGHSVDRDPEAVGKRGDLDPAHGRTALVGRGSAASMRSSISAFGAVTALGRPSTRSVRVMRSASRGGSLGRSPVAFCTASGNFAGWAVANTTIGTAGSLRWCWATAKPTAVCGSRVSP